MNSNLWTLIKFNLKYFLKPRFADSKAKKKYIGLMIFLCICFLVPIGSIVVSLYAMATVANNLGVTTELLSSVFLISQIATIFFGIITYFQIMYFSTDRDILATMPVKPRDIFISKIAVVLASEIITTALVVIPSTIVFAIAILKAGVSIVPLYYILIPLSLLLLPLVPLIFISLISYPIMLINNKLKKHPTLGAILTIILVVGIILAIYIPMYSAGYNAGSNVANDNEIVDEEEGVVDESSEDMFSSMVSEDMVQSISKIGKYSFVTLFLAKAMLGSSFGMNLVNFLIFFLISIAVFALGVFVAILFYKKTLNNYADNSGIVSKVKEQTSINSSIKALLIQMLKNMSRNTKLLVSYLMSVFLSPAMVFIMVYVMGNQGSSDPSMTAEDITMLNSISVGMGLMFAMIFLCGSNSTSSIGISSEGEQFSILKYLPIDPKVVIKTKLVVSDIFSAAGILLTTIVLAIASKATYIDILFFIVYISLFALSMNSFGLCRDLKNPKLKWVNFTEITKNNFNSMLPMLLMLIPAVIAIGLNIGLSVVGLKSSVVSLIMGSIELIIAIVYFVIFRIVNMKNVEKYFERIEC